MTIKNLIERLKEYPENLQVMVSSDPEGNEISDLWETEEVFIDEDNIVVDTSELIDDDYDNLEKVIVLWPG